MQDISFVFFLILFIVAIFLYFKFTKIPKFGAITMVTGGVKSGKSALCVHFAIKEYKRVLFRWRIQKIFAIIFRRQIPEKPLLYSNIPLMKVNFVPLTTDLLLRKQRFAFRSVVFIDEASLVADSQLIKDGLLNTDLQLFFKLFGHETHGGKMFLNSQCISDLHYSIKRVTSSYYFVQSCSRFPFVSRIAVREERFSDDGNVMNNYNEDIEKQMLNIWFLNGVFKRYDAFCYSVFTDLLKSENDVKNVRKWVDMKQKQICSFRSEFRNMEVKK